MDLPAEVEKRVNEELMEQNKNELLCEYKKAAKKSDDECQSESESDNCPVKKDADVAYNMYMQQNQPKEPKFIQKKRDQCSCKRGPLKPSRGAGCVSERSASEDFSRTESSRTGEGSSPGESSSSSARKSSSSDTLNTKNIIKKVLGFGGSKRSASDDTTESSDECGPPQKKAKRSPKKKVKEKYSITQRYSNFPDEETPFCSTCSYEKESSTDEYKSKNIFASQQRNGAASAAGGNAKYHHESCSCHEDPNQPKQSYYPMGADVATCSKTLDYPPCMMQQQQEQQQQQPEQQVQPPQSSRGETCERVESHLERTINANYQQDQAILNRFAEHEKEKHNPKYKNPTSSCGQTENSELSCRKNRGPPLKGCDAFPMPGRKRKVCDRDAQPQPPCGRPKRPLQTSYDQVDDEITYPPQVAYGFLPGEDFNNLVDCCMEPSTKVRRREETTNIVNRVNAILDNDRLTRNGVRQVLGYDHESECSISDNSATTRGVNGDDEEAW